jgi:hypothetical protein
VITETTLIELGERATWAQLLENDTSILLRAETVAGRAGRAVIEGDLARIRKSRNRKRRAA